jgi:hypothetical protein
MKDELLKRIQIIDENFSINDSSNDKYWIIENKKHLTYSSFKKDDEGIKNIHSYLKELISFQYQRNEYLYKTDQFEIIIGVLFDENEIDKIEKPSRYFENPPDNENIYYKISNYTRYFMDRIHRESYQCEFYQTIKIYNMNSVTGLSVNHKDFFKVANRICKSIVFELEQKHKVIPRFFNPLLDEMQGKAFYGKMFELTPHLLDFKKIDFRRYDGDLVNYYYRALWMEESEFKYLAFFQVVECLFDEVFKKELVQDVRLIMESSWFSTQNNSDIEKMISIIEKYNKEKNDKTKTKLVLDRYFRTEAHDEAFYLANKEIISILTQLNLISNESDLKDLQKLATIIYEYRCDCTHSNRDYPIKTLVKSTSENLCQYIELIKKIAERIILNYK